MMMMMIMMITSLSEVDISEINAIQTDGRELMPARTLGVSKCFLNMRAKTSKVDSSSYNSTWNNSVKQVVAHQIRRYHGNHILTRSFPFSANFLFLLCNDKNRYFRCIFQIFRLLKCPIIESDYVLAYFGAFWRLWKKSVNPTGGSKKAVV